MGEEAEMIIDGEVCEACGVFLKGGAVGYPRKCKRDGGEAEEEN